MGVTKIGRRLNLTWDTLLGKHIFSNNAIINLCFISASLGGIFGLCLGGSILSIVEFVYFLLINIFKKKQKRTSAIMNIYLSELLKNNRILPSKDKAADKFPANYVIKNKRVGKFYTLSHYKY